MSVMDVVANVMGGTPPAEPGAPEPEVSEEVVGVPDDLLNEVAPTPPPKVEPKDDEVDKLIESDEPPKEKKAWAKTKHELKTYKDKVRELEEKLGGQKLPEETVKEYEDRLSEMDRKVAQLSLVESESFKREYDQPILQGLGRASQLLEQHGGKSREDAQALVQRAARMSFNERNRFLMDEAPELAGVVNTILLNVDERVQVRAEAIKQSEATKAALQESQKRSSQVNAVRSLEQHLGKAVEEAALSGNFFLKKSKEDGPKAQAWNRMIDLDVEAVKQVMLKGDQAEIARLVTEGYTTRKMRDEYARVLSENKKLKAQLQDVSAVKPGMRGGDAPPPPAKEMPASLGVEGIIGQILAG